MASESTNPAARTCKPSLAAPKKARTPLTPRILGSPPPSVRSEPLRRAPRTKQDETVIDGNVTPRSSARKSRADGGSQTATPTPGDDPSSSPRPSSQATSGLSTRVASSGRNSGAHGFPRVNAPKGSVSEVGSRKTHSPTPRSPRTLDLKRSSIDKTTDGRFFHASDVAKQEPPPHKTEQQKTPAFFYADGRQENSSSFSKEASLVLSALTEKQTSGPWIRNDNTSPPRKNPPMPSPSLSAPIGASPFFATADLQHKPRSPSPSKETIHLSYRKGASQIFGTRPTPKQATPSVEMLSISELTEQKSGSEVVGGSGPHRKSPSLSSIDSGTSRRSRRRSATTAEAASPSPLSSRLTSGNQPRVVIPPVDMSKIDTSRAAPAARNAPDSALSPTKTASELAADARRERKVLDLEISNSSLLAINTSLEREIRRQKAELKRFRRLSRAGRFSFNTSDPSARPSETLSTLGEEGGDDGDYAAFGPPSGFTDVYDDFSDEDGESMLSGGGESTSPGSQSDRLANDEKRLRIDLEKHKELLLQSQMMNQSLKRCMYATEEMIKEGKKALDYHVGVGDVKLGGRVLSGEDDEVEIAEEDEPGLEDGMQQAKGFLDVWRGLGKASLEGSEIGDRDSGIEVDRPLRGDTLAAAPSNLSDSGRPPDDKREEGIV